MAHERAARFHQSLDRIRDGFAAAVAEFHRAHRRAAELEVALLNAETQAETLAGALADIIAAPGQLQLEPDSRSSSRSDSPTDMEAVAALRVLWVRGAISLRECGDIARRLGISPDLLASYWAKNASRRD